MVVFEELCQSERPDLVIVVGDVNSTLACSVVAKKLLIKVAHVEAGLRSFDLMMPEEINRMVTDAISDYFFVSEDSGIRNLIFEGKPRERIHFVGNVMIDNLFQQLKRLGGDSDRVFSTFRLKRKNKGYLFLTLHRPSNVDSKKTFKCIAEAINMIAEKKAILFPVHPRIKNMIGKYDIRFSNNIFLLASLGFNEALFLWKDAHMVITDSGGL